MGRRFRRGCPAARRIGALNTRPMKEPRAIRRDEMQPDALAAGRRAGKHDAPGISSELRDVVADPLECSPLIQDAVVAG